MYTWVYNRESTKHRYSQHNITRYIILYYACSVFVSIAPGLVPPTQTQSRQPRSTRHRYMYILYKPMWVPRWSRGVVKWFFFSIPTVWRYRKRGAWDVRKRRQRRDGTKSIRITWTYGHVNKCTRTHGGGGSEGKSARESWNIVELKSWNGRLDCQYCYHHFRTL